MSVSHVHFIKNNNNKILSFPWKSKRLSNSVYVCFVGKIKALNSSLALLNKETTYLRRFHVLKCNAPLLEISRKFDSHLPLVEVEV